MSAGGVDLSDCVRTCRFAFTAGGSESAFAQGPGDTLIAVTCPALAETHNKGPNPETSAMDLGPSAAFLVPNPAMPLVKPC